MPRPCTVCCHPLRQKIEKAVARGRSVRWLAWKYKLTKSAIHRHRHHRLPAFMMPTGIRQSREDKTVLRDIIQATELRRSENTAPMWDTAIVDLKAKINGLTPDPTATMEVVQAARAVAAAGNYFASECPICGGGGTYDHMGSCFLKELQRMLARPTFETIP